MKPDLVSRYLKHLDQLIAGLESLEVIKYEDVVPVRSELREFRRRAAASPSLAPSLRSLLETVDLRIDDRLLEGSPKTRLMRIYAIFAAHTVQLRAWRARKREAIQPEISRLRSELRELYIALNIADGPAGPRDGSAARHT